MLFQNNDDKKRRIQKWGLVFFVCIILSLCFYKASKAGTPGGPVTNNIDQHYQDVVLGFTTCDPNLWGSTPCPLIPFQNTDAAQIYIQVVKNFGNTFNPLTLCSGIIPFHSTDMQQIYCAIKADTLNTKADSGLLVPPFFTRATTTHGITSAFGFKYSGGNMQVQDNHYIMDTTGNSQLVLNHAFATLTGLQVRLVSANAGQILISAGGSHSGLINTSNVRRNDTVYWPTQYNGDTLVTKKQLTAGSDSATVGSSGANQGTVVVTKGVNKRTISINTVVKDTSFLSSYEPIPIFNVASPKYGAVGDSVTDNTTAFQNAINDAHAWAYRHNEKYAEIYVPHNGKDYYLVNGAFISTTSNSTPKIKSILTIPLDSTNQITLVIRGPLPAMLGTGLTTGLGGNVTIFTKQRDNTGTASIISSKYFASNPTYHFNFTRLIVKNLSFLMPWNSGVGAVDAGYNSQFSMQDCTGGADTSLALIEGLSAPTNKATFVRTPFNNNDGSITLSNVRVQGMYRAFVLNEQCFFTALQARDCYIAADFNDAYHLVKGERFLDVHCPYGLNFTNVSDGGGPAPTSFCSVDIKGFDIETIGSGWTQSKQEINDTNNMGYGPITWHNVQSGTGVINTIHKFNGLNISDGQIDINKTISNQILNGTLAATVTNSSSGSGAQAEYRANNNLGDVLQMGINGSGHTGSGVSHARSSYIIDNIPTNNLTGFHFRHTNANSFWFETNSDTTLFGNNGGAWVVGPGSTQNQIANFGAAWWNIAKSTTSKPCLSMIMGVSPTSIPSKSISFWGFDNSGHLADSSGLDGTINTTIFTNYVNASDSNTVVETSILGSGKGTKTLTAKEFTAGRTIHIVVEGYHSAAANPNITINIKLGSTVILTTGAVASGNGTQTGFKIDVTLRCKTVGASGLIQGTGTYTEYDNPVNAFGMVKISPIAVDLTTTQAIDVTATWGTAATTNVIVSQNARIEKYN